MSKATTPPAKVAAKHDFFPGRIRRKNEFWLDANQSLDLAQRLIPTLSRFVMIMALISVLAMCVSLGSLWLRPNPLVLLSFPDGTSRCTPPSLNPVTKKVMARPLSQIETCAELEASNMGSGAQ